MIVVVGIASPRLAAARTELSARVPVGVAFGDGTRFELGLRSDLLYMFESSLGFGISGEVRSVSFTNRAEEVGAAFAMLEDVGGATSTGLVLDAGLGAEAARRYVHARGAYQLRVRVPWSHSEFACAIATAIFVDVRRTVSGPGGWEGVAGVEIGGGLIAAYLRTIQAIVQGG